MSKSAEILCEMKNSMGAEKLMPLVCSGQISVLTQDARGRITGVVSAALVNISEESAWNILLDYNNYCHFLPGINTSKVVAHKGDEYTVKFAAGVKVMGVGGAVKYTYRIVVKRPYADVYDVEKRDESGYWAVLPIGETSRIILVHADVAKDIKDSHVFLRFLVDRLPTAEVGLMVSPVTMLVNRMKQYMEHRYCGHQR